MTRRNWLREKNVINMVPSLSLFLVNFPTSLPATSQSAELSRAKLCSMQKFCIQEFLE